MVAALIAGLVLSSRKIVSDHHWFDLISGFVLGMICQLVALWF
jgi:hypothetical protein